MKAIIQHKYGGLDQLELVEINKPVITEDQLLIKIKAVNIASGDMRVNTLDVPRILKPIMKMVFGWKGPRNKVRGITASGIIKEKGINVHKYNLKDEVYFINSLGAGCLADYIVLNKKAIMARKPKNISFIDVSPIAFGAMTAVHFINQTTVNKDTKVLIYGASGSVGTYGLQLAKYYGGTVTAVSSSKNHEVLKSIGADEVIDYKSTNIETLDDKYDIVFDAVGKFTKKKAKNILSEQGKFLSVKLPTKESVDRLEALNTIIEEGKLKTVIDTVYQVDEFKEAHIKTYSGHKVGNVVIEWK